MTRHGYQPAAAAARPEPKDIADAIYRKAGIRGWLINHKLVDARLRMRDTNSLAAHI